MQQIDKRTRVVKKDYTTDTWRPERSRYWAPCNPGKTTKAERAACIKRLAVEGFDISTLTEEGQTTCK